MLHTRRLLFSPATCYVPHLLVSYNFEMVYKEYAAFAESDDGGGFPIAKAVAFKVPWCWLLLLLLVGEALRGAHSQTTTLQAFEHLETLGWTSSSSSSSSSSGVPREYRMVRLQLDPGDVLQHIPSFAPTAIGYWAQHRVMR